MKEKILDMRGRPCPEPVVETRRALADPDTGQLVVIVDNQASAENVSRMAQSMGCGTQLEQKAESDLRVLVTKGILKEPTQPDRMPTCQSCESPAWIAVLIASSCFGQGDDELGRKLMGGFIKSLKNLPTRPEVIVFVNSGVQHTTQGSNVIEELRELDELGVQVLSCGTCLEHFGLGDKLEVGKVSNMFEIVSALASADKVIRP